jgi:hypothetical protein
MPVYDVNCRISLNPSKSKKELKEQLLDTLLCTMDSGRVRALQASDLKFSMLKEGAMKKGTVKKYPMIEGAIKHWGIAKGLSHV